MASIETDTQSDVRKSLQAWIRHNRVLRAWRTLRRDGVAVSWQAARDRVQAWLGRWRRAMRPATKYAFPLIEPSPLTDGETPRVSIVIPVFNGLTYVRECLTGIYTHPPLTTFEVVVIDQASTDGSREYLRAMATRQAHLRLIENPVNVGFPRAVNQGVASARGVYVMLVNSDVILAPGCLDRLVAALDTDDRLAVVSPVTNYVGRGPQVDPEAETLQPADIITYATRISRRMGLHPVVDHLVFFCVLLRRDVFELLNGMSEIYGLGNYEDNDYCLRARMAGFTLALVPGAFAFHFGSRTFKGQRLAYTEWMERNETLYYERMAHLSTSLPLVQRAAQWTTEPTLTVIMDAQAPPRDLITTLTSLAHQTDPCFDVIMVGDAVALAAIIHRYTAAFPVDVMDFQPSNPAAAWNEARANARGAWLTYLRAGDVLYPTCLELLLSLTTTTASVVGARVTEALVWHGGDQEQVLARAPYSRAVPVADAVWVGPTSAAPAFAHRAECGRELGDFAASVEPFADWDFLLRLTARYSPAWAETIVAEHRVRVDALSDLNEILLNLAAARQAATEAIYARHPVSDANLQRLRRHALEGSKRRMAELHWVALQNEDDATRARHLAAAWLAEG